MPFDNLNDSGMIDFAKDIEINGEMNVKSKRRQTERVSKKLDND